MTGKARFTSFFTHTLSLHDLTTLQYHGYILLYDFFFMLDNLFLFSLAALALDTAIGNRYAKYCKIIGGFILLGLGVVMAFFPKYL
ncbi:hypothetical protein ACFL6N_04720 [Thermodesulfobacteriota bacterium]